MTEVEKKKEAPPTRPTLSNPFAIPPSAATPATTVHRANPFAMAPSQHSTATSAAATGNAVNNHVPPPAMENVNKFFTNAFSSFRGLPQQQQQQQQQQQDTTKSPTNSIGGNISKGNVFAQFLPPPKVVDDSTNSNQQQQQPKQEMKEKEEILVAAVPQAKQATSSFISATTAPAMIVPPETELRMAAALIQELAMEASPLASISEAPSSKPLLDTTTASPEAAIPVGTLVGTFVGIPVVNPFDNIKECQPAQPQENNKPFSISPTKAAVAVAATTTNKASTLPVPAVNPFDNIKAFQKNASKRWMDSLKTIQDTVSETNSLVAEAFGKDDKKNTSTLKNSVGEVVVVLPTIQGMIWKKSRSNGTWEKLKLSLVDSMLSYYATVSATQPSGTYSLLLKEQQALISIKPFISSTYSSPTPFGFTLQQPPQYQQEEWILCFDSYTDMKLWYVTLMDLVVDTSMSKHAGNWKKDEKEETIDKKGSTDMLQREDDKSEEEEQLTSTTAEPSIKLVNWNILLSWSNLSLLISSYCSYNSLFFYFIFFSLNILATLLRLYSDALFYYAEPLLIRIGIITESEKSIKEEVVGEKQEVKEKKNFLPLQPGFSTIPYSEDIAEEDENKIQYISPPSNLFQVRRHDYRSSRIKTPSLDSLYDLYAVDLLQCNKRVDHFSSRIQLPEDITSNASSCKWTAPEIFMISINFPTEPPSLTGSGDDSKGFLLVCYFRMKDSTKQILQKLYASESENEEAAHALPTTTKEEEKKESSDPDASIVNAVKLLDEWCKRSPTDATFQSRFKLIPYAFNLEDLGVPSYLCKYNHKPLLIKRKDITGFYRQSPNKILHSFDISFYPFPYIAKQAISYTYGSYKDKMDLSFAFVIEGRGVAELPEVILGCVRLNKQDLGKIEKYEDYVDE